MYFNSRLWLPVAFAAMPGQGRNGSKEEGKRILRTKELKFKIALEALHEEKQVSEIAKEYRVHPQQVTRGECELPGTGSELFASKADRDTKRFEMEREELFRTFEHQKVVVDRF